MVEINTWWQMLIIFALAANPAAAAAGLASSAREASVDRFRAAIAAVAIVTALALVVLAVALADPLLELLAVDLGTFRIAAGSVVIVVAAQTIVRGHPGLRASGEGWRAGIYPLGLPLVGGPAVLAAALSWSADNEAGPWLTLAMAVPGVVLAVAVAVVAGGRHEAVFGGISRLLGVLLALAGAGLIMSGVQTV